MKIVHVIFSLNVGGAETMLVNIVNEQVKYHDVALIIINDKFDLSLLKTVNTMVRVIKINRPEGSKQPFYLLKLNYYLLILNPSVIHCHVKNIISLFLPFYKKKSMITVHHEIFENSKYLKYYSRIFAISETVKRSIFKFSGLDSILVYNGVNDRLISKKDTFVISGPFKIIMIGRLVHNIKGQHLLLESLREIPFNNIIVDIVGEGPSEKFLRELCEEYNLISKVNFLGLLPQKDLYMKICKYDLLVQPSLKEGFGLTIVEAMLAKVPVLVSSIDGPREVIGDGKYGSIFEVNDSFDLANQLITILNLYNNALITDAVNDAHEFAHKNFTIESTSKQYVENYFN